MGKLNVYNFITLNGFFKGKGGDLSWQKHGEEEAEYGTKAQKSEGMLIFGRITYDQMASYWPTGQAEKDNPEMAKGMNNAEKIVFSRTLKKADWQNSRIISDNIIDEMKKLKAGDGKDMTILGSGSIVAQFADAGLIDSYQIMLNPVALAEGTPIFTGITKNLDLKLTDTRKFKSGVVLLMYEKA